MNAGHRNGVGANHHNEGARARNVDFRNAGGANQADGKCNENEVGSSCTHQAFPDAAIYKCVICMETSAPDKRLILCKENHPVHQACLIDYVEKSLGATYYLQRSNHDTTRCPAPDCEHKWNNEFIVTFPTVSETTLRTVIVDRLPLGRNVILSAIMNCCIRCPHCGTVFDSYDNCNAVICTHCRKNFCGICFEAPDSDAHPHVLNNHGAVYDADLPLGLRFAEKQKLRTHLAIRLLNLLGNQELRYRLFSGLC